MMRLAAALLFATACGGGPPRWPGTPDLHGADLVVDTQLVYTQRSEYRPYLRTIIERTAEFYGHSPGDVAGLRIIVSNTKVPCGGEVVFGCHISDENTIRYLAGYENPDLACTDGVLLPHELLHYFLDGDPNHTAAQWQYLPALQDSLRSLSVCP